MSAPEKKVEPAQASTMALTPESFATSSSAFRDRKRTAAAGSPTGRSTG